MVDEVLELVMDVEVGFVHSVHSKQSLSKKTAAFEDVLQPDSETVSSYNVHALPFCTRVSSYENDMHLSLLMQELRHERAVRHTAEHYRNERRLAAALGELAN